MLKMSSILLFSQNPKSLADFYAKVFDRKPDWDEGGYYGFVVGSFMLTIGPHDQVKGKNPNPERMMLNFDVEDVEKEFERIKGVGAHVIAKPYEPDEMSDVLIATFADPDGNYFQLMTPWEDKRN
ncbi:MAG: VOC family protein [Candidatus Levyibacteriota bacterium]